MSGIELDHALDLIAKEGDAVAQLILVGRDDLQRVAAHPEGAGAQLQVVALVMAFDQLAQQGIAAVDIPAFQVDHHPAVRLRVADAVDAGDGCDDDDILARHQRGGGCQAQALDLLVDIGVFFDVQVVARHVGFRLVVIVVRDEVLDGVFREEFFELGVELGCQGFVVRHDQRRFLELLDHRGNGEGLAGAGGAEQYLLLIASPDTFHKLPDGLGLVAGGFERGV